MTITRATTTPVSTPRATYAATLAEETRVERVECTLVVTYEKDIVPYCKTGQLIPLCMWVKKKAWD